MWECLNCRLNSYCVLAINYNKGFAECQDILVGRISDKAKMFMVLLRIVTHFKVKKGALFCYIYNFQIVKTSAECRVLLLTHFKVKKGALFCYIYNFQIVKRLSVSIGDTQIESPIRCFIAHLDEDAVFTNLECYRDSAPIDYRATVPSSMCIHFFLV